MSEISSLYQEKYGDWAGKPQGSRLNYSLCCVEVTDYSTRWPRSHQCSKKRGHGPDSAYCKQHDPEVVAARDAANKARSKEKWNKRRYEIHGRSFFCALQAIADGHNDARGLAQEVIAKFKDGEVK